MTPMHEDTKKRILEDAAKAFPGKTEEELKREFSDYQRLLSKQFMSENGEISEDERERLDQLRKQFSPFINGPRNQ